MSEEKKELESSCDDGFEVLDPEPDPDPEEEKCPARDDLTNAGTIIFCHMLNVYSDIHDVSCQYLRPENWKECPEDEIAILEVGWNTILESVARLPVRTPVPDTYPLGSVDLKDFEFRSVDYLECPGSTTYFQLCYLRKGEVLGASTPFGIRGIKAYSLLDSLVVSSCGCDSGMFGAEANDDSKQPADDQPPDDQPSDDQPSDPQAADDQPSDGQPSGGQPSEDQPSENQVRDGDGDGGDGDGDGDGDGEDAEDEDLECECSEYLAPKAQFSEDQVPEGRPSQLPVGDGPSMDKASRLKALGDTINGMARITSEMKHGQSPASALADGSISSSDLKNLLSQLNSSMQEVAEAWCMLATSKSDLSNHCGSGARGDPWMPQLGIPTDGDMLDEADPLYGANCPNLLQQQMLSDLEGPTSNGLDREAKMSRLEDELLLEKAKFVEADSELKIVKEDLQLKKMKIEEMELELTQRGFKWMSAESEVKNMHNKLLQEESKRQTAEGELKRAFEELLKKQERLNVVEAELKEHEKDLAKKNAYIIDADNLIAELKARLINEETKCNDALFELKVVKDELHRREITFNDTRKELEKAKDDHAHAEAKQYDLLAEARKAKIESRGNIDALKEEQALIWRQVDRVQDEALLYKSQLDKSLGDLKSANDETERAKEKCAELKQSRDTAIADNARLQEALAEAQEESRRKQESLNSAAEMQRDVMVKELLKKSDELDILQRQLEDLKAEVSRVNADRASLQNSLTELQQALNEQEPPAATPCMNRCCTSKAGVSLTAEAAADMMITEVLDDAHQRITELEQALEEEKRRSEGLQEKVRVGADRHRFLLMEKIALQERLKEVTAARAEELAGFN